jgi:hypothetical protein
MARARNIKPGFFKNEDLAECTPWARLCFIGLWGLADREGRQEDRPKRIKGEVFPFDAVEVEPLLAELAQWGFIVRYQFGGKRYIQIANFAKHQAPHGTEKDSDIPDAQGLLTVHERGKNGYATGIWSFEAIPLTVKEHEPVPDDSSSLTVIGGMSDRVDNALNPDSLIPDLLNPDTPQPPKGGGVQKPKGLDFPPGFDEFYAAYRRKDAKQDAVKAWKHLAPDESLRTTILAALAKWQWNPDRTKIPLPASWLRGRRWEDESVTASVPFPGFRPSRHSGFDQIDYTQGVNEDGSIPA